MTRKHLASSILMLAVMVATVQAQVTVKDAKKAIPTPTVTQTLNKALKDFHTAKNAEDVPAIQAAMVQIQEAQKAVKKEQVERRKAYKKYRTRYLRYLKANSRRITRLSRQVRGMAAKLQYMAKQAGIQARSNAHYRHDTTPHGHPHH